MKTHARWSRFHATAAIALTGMALVFLVTEHLDHLLEYFPLLILLLCPLMHLFMHKGHAAHHGNPDPRSLDEAYRKGLEEGRKSRE